MALILIAGGKGGTEEQEVYRFDAVLNVDAKRSSTVTKHPVETGVTITDHVFTNNTIIEISGVVTNHPIPQKLFNPVIGQDRIEKPFEGARVRVQSAYDVIVKSFNDKELITISHEFDSFANCIITNLSIPRNAQIGESMSIKLTLEQLQIVSTDISEVSPEIFDAASVNKKKGSGSSVDPEAPSASNEEKVFGERMLVVYRDYTGKGVAEK
jgi:hypothetical protein